MQRCENFLIPANKKKEVARYRIRQPLFDNNFFSERVGKD